MRYWELKGQDRYWLLHINSLAVLFQNLKIHADTEKGSKAKQRKFSLERKFCLFFSYFPFVLSGCYQYAFSQNSRPCSLDLCLNVLTEVYWISCKCDNTEKIVHYCFSQSLDGDRSRGKQIKLRKIQNIGNDRLQWRSVSQLSSCKKECTAQ